MQNNLLLNLPNSRHSPIFELRSENYELKSWFANWDSSIISFLMRENELPFLIKKKPHVFSHSIRLCGENQIHLITDLRWNVKFTYTPMFVHPETFKLLLTSNGKTFVKSSWNRFRLTRSIYSLYLNGNLSIKIIEL